MARDKDKKPETKAEKKLREVLKRDVEKEKTDPEALGKIRKKTGGDKRNN